MELLSELFQKYDDIIMVGGSGLYADALCYGLDDFPAADQQLRKTLTEQAFGTEFPALQQRLRELDPDSLNFIDISNKQRVIRALEVTLSTGKKYSSFRTAPRKKRFFEIERFALNMPREILYDRINRRVDMMVEQGLVQEVQDLIDYRDMPALRTVGYKEIFEYLDGDISLERAIDLIKRDTRRYAKRQVTYFAKERQVEVQL
jgi:tRNA dimethylallyltransferase